MTVNSVIDRALRLVGRADAAEALSDGTMNDEQKAAVNTLLYCFNAVEDHLSRKFLPLKAVQTASVSGGKVYYTQLAHTPLRIRKVLSDGEQAYFRTFPKYIETAAEGSVTVEYDYSPNAKELGDECEYADGGEMIACGMAAEYCLINGEAQASEMWDKKYLEQADKMQQMRVPRGYLPLRSWQ